MTTEDFKNLGIGIGAFLLICYLIYAVVPKLFRIFF